MNKEQELCKYFKMKSEFKNVLKIMKEKYESFGKFTGKINKNSISKEEKDVISNITGKNYEIGSRYIEINDIVKSLEETKFAGVNFHNCLEIYFNEKIVYNKDKQENYEMRKNRFFNEICLWHENTNGGNFLSNVYQNGKGYNLLIKEYNKFHKKDKLPKFEIVLEKIIEALNSLPITNESYELLPMFASRIANDPHFFDNQNFAGRFFLYGLSFIYNKNYPKNSEKRAELYLKSGIIIDDISNNVAISGLKGKTKGIENRGWEGFYNDKEYFITPISGITNLDKVYSKYDFLLVVENPAVFVVLFNYYKNEKNIVIPMICGYGNIKLAALLLMDLAVENGLKILYSGDIDPEGLLIADRLKTRYKDSLDFIGFSKENYKNYISFESISDKSMKKLEKLETNQLIEISKLVKENSKKSFQENFIDSIIEEVELFIR